MFATQNIQKHSNPAYVTCQQMEEEEEEKEGQMVDEEWEINGGGDAGTDNESCNLVGLHVSWTRSVDIMLTCWQEEYCCCFSSLGTYFLIQ